MASTDARRLDTHRLSRHRLWAAELNLLLAMASLTDVYAACYPALFASAIDIVNSLAAAQAADRLKQGLNRDMKPRVLLLDELGYLPIDKTGADLLFQIISQRYECCSTVIANRDYRKWPEIFNNDATLTSAVLDRLLHHSEAVVIEGRSFRLKDANPES